MSAPYGMTLAEQTGRRLLLAPFDVRPALATIRAWNHAIRQRAAAKETAR